MAYYEDILVDQIGRVKCGLCKILIEDNDILIEEHLKESEHIELFMERLRIRNNIRKINKRIMCGICNEIINISNFLDHVQSKSHITSKETIEELIKKDGGFLQLPQSITNRGAAIYCLICDRCFDFNLNVAKDHVHSPRHRRARSIAVQPLNGIFSVDGSNVDLYCKICKVYIENYMEVIFEHVDMDTDHALRLGKILKLIDGQNINIEKFLYDPAEDKGRCLKCDIEVACNVDNLNSHVNGKKHNL